jgi:catalase
MNASQKEQLFSNFADAVQGVPDHILARPLVHSYKADPGYGRGAARKPGLDMETYVRWTKLSLKELAEKSAE